MSEQKNDIEKLIRLKRYEQPTDGYFDDFLAEFQSRQRSELLHRSARSLFFERVGTYFSDFSRLHWVYAGSAAYAAVTVGFFLVTGFGGVGGQAPPSGADSVAATVASDASVDNGSSLWDERRIVLVEDDPIDQRIAERRELMSSEAEWDLNVLPTSARGISSKFVPVKNGEGSPEAEPVTRPAGLDL